MSFGVTPTGYNLKTQEVIDTEAELALQQVTDPATGETFQADLSDPSDIVSQIVAIPLEGIADGMLIDQAAYNQFDPGKATEDALSTLVLINGIFRLPASHSLVDLDFTGTPSVDGSLETGDMGALINFDPPIITDGEFTISIDGNSQDILALNFGATPDYDDIALTVQTALQAVGTGGYTLATVTASSPTAPSKLTITTGTVGGAVSFLSAVAGGLGTDVSGPTYLNGLTGTIIPGLMSSIPTGIQVSNNNKTIIWETLSAFTFDTSGVASGVKAQSVDRGALVAKSGTLTKLITPSGVITSVTNPLDAIVGRETESDNALRRRRDLSTYAPSIGLVGSLDANLKAVPGVTFSRVYNNIKLIPDANGIPAKTVGCVVLGGSDEEVAQVIFERSSLGTDFAGTTTIQFQDKIGTLYDIKFFRPTQILIDVEVDISLESGAGEFPDDGADQIKQALVDYSIGGSTALGITEGFDIVGFPPGQDVLHTRLYTPVNSVPGHVINTIKLKKTVVPTFLESDVSIGFDEVSDFQFVNIEVVVT